MSLALFFIYATILSLVVDFRFCDFNSHFSLTFSGATFLTIIALLPSIFMGITGMNLYFGGTSLLIAVGVALDTMKQIESHLLMRHYQGFMK